MQNEWGLNRDLVFLQVIQVQEPEPAILRSLRVSQAQVFEVYELAVSWNLRSEFAIWGNGSMFIRWPAVKDVRRKTARKPNLD